MVAVVELLSVCWCCLGMSRVGIGMAVTADPACECGEWLGVPTADGDKSDSAGVANVADSGVGECAKLEEDEEEDNEKDEDKEEDEEEEE